MVFGQQQGGSITLWLIQEQRASLSHGVFLGGLSLSLWSELGQETFCQEFCASQLLQTRNRASTFPCHVISFKDYSLALSVPPPHLPDFHAPSLPYFLPLLPFLRDKAFGFHCRPFVLWNMVLLALSAISTTGSLCLPALFRMTSTQRQLPLTTCTSLLEFVGKICISWLKITFNFFFLPFFLLVYMTSVKRKERCLNSWHFHIGVPLINLEQEPFGNIFSEHDIVASRALVIINTSKTLIFRAGEHAPQASLTESQLRFPFTCSMGNGV